MQEVQRRQRPESQHYERTLEVIGNGSRSVTKRWVFGRIRTFGEQWRVTPGVAWVHGDMTDFLGQYRRNSYASLGVRYSF